MRLPLAALLVLAVPLLVAPAAPAAEPPSLRLFAADPGVRTNRFELASSMHVGLWVAATGGSFRVHAQRPDYGRWGAAQVDAATGAPLRSLPPELLDGADGLKRFLVLRIRDRTGRTVVHRTLDFCPGMYERVSDDGPRVPSYLGFCGTGFPFVRGTVWGIDQGWASALGGEFHPARHRPLSLRPGRYRVLAAIREPFRELLAIPTEHAEAQVRLRVERVRRDREHLPPPPTPAPLSAFAAQATGSPDPATLPDLVALPPWRVDANRRGRRDVLDFAATPWNAGPGPLVVEGFRQPGDDVMDARQYFLDRDGAATGSAPAGQMAFHDRRGHHHWHFLQFVAYRMRRAEGGEVTRSRKQSFCLASTDPVDLTVPGADMIPDFIGLGTSACGDGRSIWMREVLPAGWGDTYAPGVAGQHFDITGVPNGRYLLEMQVNPRGKLHETSTANNVAQRRIVLRGKRGARRVRVAPWHGIDR